MITEQGLARVRGVLRRRRLPIVAVATVGLVGAGALIAAVPSRYRAQAVVRALESQPARDYVAPTVAEQTGERLRTLRLGVMARPLLATVAEELALAPPGASAATRERIVDGMRGRVEVKVEGDDTFLVTYDDSDPARAERVVNRLVERFVGDQVARRRAMATATERALAAEAERLKPEVARLAEVVRRFKLEHYGALPEQQEQNLRTLDQTTMEINIQATNLDVANERRRQLLGASVSPLRRQEELLLTELHTARTRYVPEHPEVRRVEREYARTHEKRMAEEAEMRTHAPSPELMGLEGEIRRTAAQLEGLRTRQAELRRRMAETAKNGQALVTLEADFQAAQAKHAAVVSRLRDAELAASLERGLAGLRYQIVEAAARPGGAIFPNRPVLALAALLVCLGAALGLGFALDRSDSRIYAPAELGALGRPLAVLACVPDLDGVATERRRGKKGRPEIDGGGDGAGRLAGAGVTKQLADRSRS